MLGSIVQQCEPAKVRIDLETGLLLFSVRDLLDATVDIVGASLDYFESLPAAAAASDVTVKSEGVPAIEHAAELVATNENTTMVTTQKKMQKKKRKRSDTAPRTNAKKTKKAKRAPVAASEGEYRILVNRIGDDIYIRVQDADKTRASAELPDPPRLDKNNNSNTTAVKCRKTDGAEKASWMMNEKLRTCYVCNDIYPSVPDVTAHIKTAHPSHPLYRCPEPGCLKTDNNRSNFFRHYKTHLDIREYKCIKCTRAFTQSNNLKVHMKNVHGLIPVLPPR